MSFSSLFIDRPKATSLLALWFCLLGLMAYWQLPVSALPQVDYPTMVVSTMLPGASAQTMAETVTTVLERQFGQIPALNQMTSVTSFGSSQITLQFALDRSIDAAEQDVQAAINTGSNLLPKTLPTPPTYSKNNPADTPILTLGISSSSIPLYKVDDYADSILAQKISQVSGVGLVTLNGGQKPAVRVQVQPELLASANLTLEDVRNMLVLANVNQPKGTLDGKRLAYTIATNDQLVEAKSYADMVLAYKQGTAIRLKDVANVFEGVENTQLAGWADGQRAIILNVQRQPGANVIEVVDRIKKLLPKLQSSLPSDLKISVLSDRTQTVRASLADVQMTLLLTIVLVVLIIYVFIRNVRSTVIAAVTVPMSLLVTCAVMQALHFSLNNLSMMALTISTGFVVDDAIVMIENITRYMSLGHTAKQAAHMGAKQIAFTILSLTISLVAVLIPLFLMPGLMGRLFYEFAITLGVAIVVSALLSLTVTPTMCAQMLAGGHTEPANPLEGNSLFAKLTRLYRIGLLWSLRHRRTMLGLTVATCLLTSCLAWLIPKGLFPQQDTGLILATSEVSPDASFQDLSERQQRVANLLANDPEVEHVASFIGVDGSNAASNVGRFVIALQKNRQVSMHALLNRLQAQIESLPGIRVYLQPVQDLQIDTRLSRSQYQYTLEDANNQELYAFAPKFLQALSQLKELKDVTYDLNNHGLALDLHLDHDLAYFLGVTPQALDDTLYDAFGQRQISTIYTQLNQYRVIMEVQPAFAANPEKLSQLYVNSQLGSPVLLSNIVSQKMLPAPLVINHQGQFSAVTLSFNLAHGVALGDAVNAILRTEATLQAPAGVRGRFQGVAADFQESLAGEPLLILAAIVTVYIVLGILYESYIHPVTILSTLPSAGVGAFLALLLCGQDFGLVALIGIILLIGIVKKNAIMMIDFALQAQREQNMPCEEAIYQACLLRFRPIMMTTMAALLGGLPLALGQGTGADLRQPLGISIVGGLCISQILTLYTTPVVYLYMDKFERWLKNRRQRLKLNQALLK